MSSSLDAIFRPMSIAVIGASRREQSLGYKILDNLLMHGFDGAIYPVNPNAEIVHSMKCYPSVEDIPDPVNMAVIVVPKEYVAEALDQCGRKGVKGVVVITAGFKEVGGEGEKLEKEILGIVRKYGMRMVGPNCMGVLNTDPNVRMDATFAPNFPPTGSTAFLSESGALGVIILNRAVEVNLGLSRFVSIGNRADLSPNDLLEDLENDDKTNLILMYLEHFGNPRKFTQIARRIIKKKPIIVVKSGRTMAGARAASSHTGAMASTDEAADSLFEQCGVIRVSSVEELFDTALAFSNQPCPKGNKTAIVTNAGGPGILLTDVCVSHGLEVPELSKESQQFLKKHLGDESGVKNPIDLISHAGPKEYAIAMKAVLEDPGIDSVIAMFVTPILTTPLEIARSISSVAMEYDKPVLGCFMGGEDIFKEIEASEGSKIPFYLFPESAGKALAEMVRYQRMRERDEGEYISFDVDKDRVSNILKNAIKQERTMLEADEVCEVLEAYGIKTAPWDVARSAEDAVHISKRLGLPVVMKGYGSDLVHKTEASGVILDLDTQKAVANAYKKLSSRFDRKKVFVQKMIKGGKEVITGMTHDPVFGPLVMFGLGGIYVEILQDVNFRINPITTTDADEMIKTVRGAALLEGVRGEPRLDQEALRDTLLKVSQLVHDFTTISEMDINPLLVMPEGEGCIALDARISIYNPLDHLVSDYPFSYSYRKKD